MSRNRMSLEELNIKEIGIWPIEYKIVVLTIFSSVIFVLLYMLFLKDNYMEFKKLGNKINESINVFKENYKQSVNLELYIKQMIEIQEMLKSVLKKLPSKGELPILLEDISQQAISAGLDFELIKPEDPVDKGFYFEQPITMVLTGKYHGFGKFAAGISGLSRIVTLHNFSITNKSNNSPNIPGTVTLSISTQAKTYWYVNKEQL